MHARIICFFYALLTFICTGEQAHEYLRVRENEVPFFGALPEMQVAPIISGEKTSDKFDVEHIKQAVYDLVVVTKDAHEVVKVASSATAFAVQVGNEILIAGSYHVLGRAVGPGAQFAVLAKGSDGIYFHMEKFQGVSAKTDFVLMKPSRALQFSFVLASATPNPLDKLYSCGRLGRFSGVFRSGELMAKEETYFLTSIAATQGSSGSPVFNEAGQLVGMVIEVIPLLRESGLYTGDHFAEYVMAKCRAF